MRSLLGLLFLYLLLKAFLVGIGMGIGFILHWIVPAIDLGMAVLIGVITTGFSMYFFARLFALADTISGEGTASDMASSVTYLIDPIPPIPRPRRSRRKP